MAAPEAPARPVLIFLLPDLCDQLRHRIGGQAVFHGYSISIAVRLPDCKLHKAVRAVDDSKKAKAF